MKLSVKTLRFLPFVLFAFFIACNSDEENEPNVLQGRYEEEVFDNFDLNANIPYANNVTQGGESLQLVMDLYTPTGDDATDRPLIVYAHSGGFVSGNKSEALLIAPLFARSGYVVASISYRLIDIERTEQAASRAVLDASHDMRAAIRYLKTNYDTYGIDTLNVFIGGFSAGAFTALQTGYVNSVEEIRSFGGEVLVTYLSENGGIEGDSGNPGISTPIKGVFSIAGALGSASFVEAGEPVLFSVHGTADEVVPFNSGDGDGTGVIVEGSNLIHQVANQVGLTNELIVIEGGGHEAIIDCDDCSTRLRAFIFENLR